MIFSMLMTRRNLYIIFILGENRYERKIVESDNSRKLATDELELDIKLDAEDDVFESVWGIDDTGDDEFRESDAERAGLGPDIKLGDVEIREESDSDNRLDDSDEETDRSSLTLLGNDSEGYRE
ncbi:hypothetical protein IW261DRAFT_1428046 [Armillaria novae-zelandiae]|uniref:Uncharacterized protein n=1 Tax=Armillaria novae-zelandiae TaxID=153914 RepID=A0AA39NBS2_9AGAR|nr:hypothetical protein IW261DRAFT_1428046 [Armillaria novae-zelandiae]